MKKGKVIGKGQIAVGVMVVALAAAIWLNSKYLPSGTKYLGETALVNGSSSEATETSAKAKTEAADYFKSAQKERETARENAIKTVEELLDNKNLTETDKKSALEKIEKIGTNALTESNIETLIKAKGFEKCLAVIIGKRPDVVYSNGCAYLCALVCRCFFVFYKLCKRKIHYSPGFKLYVALSAKVIFDPELFFCHLA